VGLEFAYNKGNVDPMRLSGNTINMGPMRGGRQPDYMVGKGEPTLGKITHATL